MTIPGTVRKSVSLYAGHPASRSLLLAGLLAGALASAAVPLAAQQLRYKLRPSVTWTEWDESLGLGKARSLGGSAGLGFGEYVDLTAFYRKSDSRSTHLSGLPFTAHMRTPPADQQLDIDSWGAEVSIGLARGSLVPVLMGGAGILRFRPEAGSDIRRVQLRYGAGLRTRVLDLFEGEVMVERSRYYLDPLELAAPVSVGDAALPEDPGAGALRRNLALRVGLMLQLGEPDYPSLSDRYRAGDRRFRSPIVQCRGAVRTLRRRTGLRSRLRHRRSGHRRLPRRLRTRPFRGAARLLLAGRRRPPRMGGRDQGIWRGSAVHAGRPRAVLASPAGRRRQDGVRSGAGFACGNASLPTARR